jgi:hypothetical protein
MDFQNGKVKNILEKNSDGMFRQNSNCKVEQLLKKQ